MSLTQYPQIDNLKPGRHRAMSRDLEVTISDKLAGYTSEEARLGKWRQLEYLTHS